MHFNVLDRFRERRIGHKESRSKEKDLEYWVPARGRSHQCQAQGERKGTRSRQSRAAQTFTKTLAGMPEQTRVSIKVTQITSHKVQVMKTGQKNRWFEDL